MAWELDPMHTQIGFSVKHMMVTTVRGQFKKYSADLNLNEQHPETSTFAATIDAASIDTGVEYRDTHLRNADFFDVEHFPAITYTSKKVEKLSQNQYRVIGDLTMRGVTQEVPLKFTIGGPHNTQRGRKAVFTATGSISRKQWGLLWNVALESGGWTVSDKVQLEIEAEVAEKIAETAAASA